MNNNTKKDTMHFIGISCSFILLLSAVMVLSPWAYRFEGAENASVDIIRGDDTIFGEAINPEIELLAVTDAIESLRSMLPSYPYFDRFYSKERRSELKEARAEIYELQWKRILLLHEIKQTDTLNEALKDYVKIIGHHQAEASRMLNLLSSLTD